MTDRQLPERSGWSLLGAFTIGAVLGACGGAMIGWLRYEAFEIGHFSSHILGGLFIVGFGLLAVAAIRNWLSRNPM